MAEKIKRIGNKIVYALWSNLFYGFIVYSVFMWLAGYSLVYAYLGNIALIVAGLAIDKYMYNTLKSEKFFSQMQQQKDKAKNYRLLRWIVDNFVSFKSMLYLFYIVILIISKTIEFSPALIGERIGDFIRANDYSILFLLAFDTLIGQFSKDRERMKNISERLRKWYADSP